MNKKRLGKIGLLATASVLSAAFVLSMTACGGTPNTPPAPPAVTYSVNFNEQIADTENSWAKTSVENPITKNTVEYYVIKNVVYCETPTHNKNQALNIYVPAAYLNADGTVNTEATVGEFTAETAPIVYLNNVSGYSAGAPWEINSIFRQGSNQGWYYNYLELGYVLVFAGARGIDTTYKVDGVNRVLRGAPISLVDLKAGIRFLRHNDELIPGDTDKIITSGVSAGGNMSALLGVTGNTNAFDNFLEEIGAVMDEKDDVFASQDYCPITDLDHAAAAYEWYWQGNAGLASSNMKIDGFEGAMSAELAKAYAAYINEIKLKDENNEVLTLNEDGSRGGSFYDWMVAQYEAAYNAYVAVSGDTDSSKYAWLSYNETNGASLVLPDTYTDIFAAMMGSNYNVRQKAVMSFDGPTYDSTSDSGVFGIYLAPLADTDKIMQHFTIAIADALETLKDEYPTEYGKYYEAYKTQSTSESVLQMIDWYSPYYWINLNETDICQNFRICVGTQDRDTSPTISATLALALRNAGYSAEYNLVWNQIHTDADLTGAFETWVAGILSTEND